ncbi:MAG: glycosyl hydrolase family protein [Bacteroidales bacterium]|nr:MAG: glycosyl hydrolase family protein [Bacteroidales bacterium]
MANIVIKLKLLVIRLTGRFPKTEALEAKDKALQNEFDEFNNFEDSADYKKFQELKAWLETKEHEKVKQELKALTFKSSSEFQTEKEYQAICKNKALINYLQLAETSTPKDFVEIEKTGLPQKFAELETYIKSPEYKKERKRFAKENAEEYQKEIQYIELKQNEKVKIYFKLKKSKALQNYFQINDSEQLAKHSELKAKVESKEFTERKAYLLSTDKFEKTEQYQKLQEYNKLNQSEKIKWYFKVKKSDKFKEIKKWELTFCENFESKKLDQQRWLTKLFWGEALLNSSYSLASDSHWYTDGNNISIDKGILKITTRKEKANGLSWDSKFGFVPKDFDYTSGIISTGNSFRQQHGRFEAKIKMNTLAGIYHAFWLVGDKMLPEIDIFRKKGEGSSSLQGAFFWENGEKGKPKKSIDSVNGLSLDSEFYILGVDWNEQKITWKINGIPFKVETNNLPKGAVYIVFSSGINGKIDESKLPATFEVDWVKCWAHKKG